MIESLISAAVPEASWLPVNVPPCAISMESVFLWGRVGPLPGLIRSWERRGPPPLEEALRGWRWGRKGYSGWWVAEMRSSFWTPVAGVALLFLLTLFWVQLVQVFSPPLMQLNSPRYLFCRAEIVLIILWLWQNQFLLVFPPHLHSTPCWPVSSSAEGIPEMLPLQFCQPGWLPSLSSWMCWPRWTPPYSSSTFSSPKNRWDLEAKDLFRSLVHTVLQAKWEQKPGPLRISKKEKKRLKIPSPKKPWSSGTALLSPPPSTLWKLYQSNKLLYSSPFTSWKTKTHRTGKDLLG